MRIYFPDDRYQNALRSSVSKIPDTIPKDLEQSVALSKYYFDDIEDVLREIHNEIIQSNDFLFLQLSENEETINPFQDAFTENHLYELAGALGAALHYYIYTYQLALNDNTGNSDPSIDDVLKFRKENTRARSVIKAIIAHFKANIIQLCKRLKSDWQDINDLFFPNAKLIGLNKIQTTGSDFHKKGKQVLILSFTMVPNPSSVRTSRFGGATILRRRQNNQPAPKFVNLIYKPSDIELDCRIAGDTEAISTSIPHVFNEGNDAENPAAILPTELKNSLFEIINEILHERNISLNRKPFRLPVYKFLPRLVGSQKIGEGDEQRVPDIDASYGYIEFLSHNPDRNEQGQPIISERSGKSDWFTRDLPKLRYYYRLHGWYLAIALTLSMADIHKENVICHQKRPHLIDLEISMKWRMKKIEDTYLTDAIKSGGYPHKVHLKYRKSGSYFSSLGNSASEQIKQGYQDALDFLGEESVQEKLTAAWIQLDSLSNTIARYTPISTAAFGKQLRRVYGKVYSLIPLPPDTFNLAVATAAEINATDPTAGSIRYLTEDGVLNRNPNGDALSVVEGDFVEFDGTQWLKHLPPLINKEREPIKGVASVNALNAGAILINEGDAYVIRGENGQLGDLEAQQGDIVQRTNNGWAKRASYSMPFVEELRSFCQEWYQKKNNGGRGRPNFSITLPDHNWRCYMNGDYPAYYRRLGSKTLLNARGKAVSVAQPFVAREYVKMKTTLKVVGQDGDEAGSVRYWSRDAVTIPTTTIQIRHHAGNVGEQNINRELSVSVVDDAKFKVVTITFGTDENGASIVPSANEVIQLVKANEEANRLVSAVNITNGVEAGNPGEGSVGLQPPTSLAFSDPLLQIKGENYFDYDRGNQYPAVTAIELVREQLGRLRTNETRISLYNDNVDGIEAAASIGNGQEAVEF